MLVVCNGARRSGSTLQFNLTRSLLEQTGEGVGGGFFTPGELTNLELNRLIEEEGWTVIKAHHIEPAILTAASQSSRCVILFTYRDLRDVAVSAQRFWKLSWDDTFDVLRQSVEVSGALEGHPQTLAQRYESLLSQTRPAIEEVAAFLQIPLNDSLIDDIWDASSPESARKAIASIPLSQRAIARSHLLWKGVPEPIRQALRETGLGSRLRRRLVGYANVVEPASQLHPRHISNSRGRPGTWRDILTASQVSQIESMFGDWLVAHGYQLSASDWFRKNPDSSDCDQAD